MDTKVAAVAAARDPVLAPVASPPPRAPAPAPVPQGPEPGAMRLVIEKDSQTGDFVYKTVNRLTGEVVLQRPRAEVLRMRGLADYAAGTVFSADV
jgi:flagellar protein FlaG